MNAILVIGIAMALFLALCGLWVWLFWNDHPISDSQIHYGSSYTRKDATIDACAVAAATTAICASVVAAM